MTTSLRSKAEFLRKLKDFDLSDHARLFAEGAPVGLGIFTMQRMAQACGANHDHVKQDQITALIEDPLVSKGLPELSRLDARALYWECVYASVQENRHRFSIHKDEFLLPFNERKIGKTCGSEGRTDPGAPTRLHWTPRPSPLHRGRLPRLPHGRPSTVLRGTTRLPHKIRRTQSRCPQVKKDQTSEWCI